MWEGNMGGRNSSLGNTENSRISAPPGVFSSREFSCAASFQAMSAGGISGILGSLLQLEENFSSCLARIDALILKPLLQAEPQDPKEKENFQLLVLLNDRFQTLWNFTEENSRILRGKSQVENSGCIQDFYILWKGDLFLSLYIHEAWKLHKAVLKEFLRDFPSEKSLALALHSALHQPFQEHVRSSLRLLQQLHEQLQQGSERDVVAAVAQEFGKLESFIGQVLDEAGVTKELWKSLGYKFTDVLCVPERRLLEDSRNLPIASGTARSERLLLFDDVLGNSFQSFDLKLVWVDENCGEKSAPGLYSLRITTPEETFVLSTKDPQMKAVWRWKLAQAVRQALNGKRDFPLWGRGGEDSEAPSRRFFSYGFRRDGRLRGATYEGEWLWGKPHGKGTLKWRDGRNHVGDFQEGLEHGFGICLVPRRSEDRYDCYKCHWYQGKMRGYGICEYGNDLVYKGYFKDNVRQGFGILENFSAEHPFKYTGQWENDRKNGYGVWEDKERGERYIGMWLDDHRHGEGIVVTQSGLCYQRTFHADKMVGSGILLLEDGSVYEGNFTEDLTFVGKGKLSLPNGFVLQGTFGARGTHGRGTHGCGTHGISTHGISTHGISTHGQLGLKEFPVEKRWTGIFEQFLEFLHSGCKEEMEESFTGFHIQTSKELRKSQEYLFCQRGAEEVSWKIEEILEELVQHQEPESLQSYLEKALGCSLHPLGKLLGALSAAFQATYSGIGANRHLLPMAQEEVKFYSRKIWEFYQGLLRLALERKGRVAPEDADPRDSKDFLELQVSPGEFPGDLKIQAFPSEFAGDLLELQVFPRDSKDLLELQVLPGDSGNLELQVFPSEFPGDLLELQVSPSEFPGDLLELQVSPSEFPGDLLELQAFPSEFPADLLELQAFPSEFPGDLLELQVFPSEFPGSPGAPGFSHLGKGSSLVLPLILPGFYPELSMLYMLQHQREDELYCQGIVELSLFPDIQLLEFLDVQKHLWPLKDLTLTSNQAALPRLLSPGSTTVDPREKLEILRKTYEELERAVSRLPGAASRLPMDDLLPLLLFVVSRAKIQHLGAEIHLIRDLMDPTNQGGMLDFLLTALESCYEHIQRIRLHPKENSHSS
ncbi:ALS2 C-terminal-like protein [Lonchura striata]|uniref:ALS2 C-terminal-like protein n=1 Tax=Lonchura striata TaxID=40157 RepID=A0A218UDW6_9PASE|nr:ALS2 C-terminal-like protein [Lonchura striata domestica]